ncbi:MAG TPA: hypothetical protein DCQ98_18495 [Planctomycetaceae bacterium]|nr:hypothetical protein [Planctomycetaceae bacterium]HRE99649.1 hypothetical protein [Pirellulaceae bacterium]
MPLNAPIEQADTKDVQRHVMDSFDRFEASFRRKYPAVWASSIIGPIVLTIVLLGAIWAIAGFGYMNKVLGAAFITFVFFSRFVILTGADPSQESISFLTREQLFLMITYMDLVMAVVVTFHIGLMFKLPLIGEKIGSLVGDAQFIIRSSPWMRRVAFIGLTVFVMIPLAATGCIGGAIFGRLLGLGRGLTLFGLIIGSIAGNGLMYFGARWIHSTDIFDNPWFKYGGLAIVIICIIGIERYYQMMKRRFLNDLAARNAAASEGTVSDRSE